MTLQELQTYFGTSDGYFYKCSVNKSDMDICHDLQVSSHTLSTLTEKFVLVESPIEHIDYQLIIE